MKEFTLEVLRRILTALREMRFGDAIKLVDESTLNEGRLVGFVRETAGLTNSS